jgi:hypothetical protein
VPHRHPVSKRSADGGGAFRPLPSLVILSAGTLSAIAVFLRLKCEQNHRPNWRLLRGVRVPATVPGPPLQPQDRRCGPRRPGWSKEPPPPAMLISGPARKPGEVWGRETTSRCRRLATAPTACIDIMLACRTGRADGSVHRPAQPLRSERAPRANPGISYGPQERRCGARHPPWQPVVAASEAPRSPGEAGPTGRRWGIAVVPNPVRCGKIGALAS